ncbi:MAG: hypothetical protein DRN91_01115 [Candidatus Alkanophagales archaeon]|nr:MAG: hypothetical protein DRN91_01115 [Candidatus Alkanophagales archaeon]
MMSFRAGVQPSFLTKTLVEAGLPEQAKVLEVGCGTNVQTALELLEFNGSVLVLDVSETQMQEYKKKLGESAAVHILVADAQALPFRDCSLDCVVFYYAFDWIPIFGGRNEAVVAEVFRVLKPSGVLVSFEYWERGAESRATLLKMAGFSAKIIIEEDELVVIGRK